MKTIKEIAEHYKQKIIEYRRYLHMHPELTNQEFHTSDWIKEKLGKLNIPTKDGISGNSIVGYIAGHKPGPCIAFRADMDALPIQEIRDVSYKSVNPGVMHACGHDAHTAILMCLAEALAENKDLIEGTVVFLFQQGEEGGKGAEKLVQDGAMTGVDSVFGLHVGTNVPVGTITTGAGIQTASSDTFIIEIQGKGTHGATPHEGIDPITTGCTIVSELSLIRSKLMNPLEPFVVNVCQFSSGHAANVVPEQAILKGTVRCFNESVRLDVAKHISNICDSISKMRGCSCTVAYDFITPSVINAEKETTLAIEAIKEQGYTVLTQPAQIISEDFACLSKVTPGCFYVLGAGNMEKGLNTSPHHPNFDIDEDCLQIGLECMLSVYRKAVSTFEIQS